MDGQTERGGGQEEGEGECFCTVYVLLSRLRTLPVASVTRDSTQWSCRQIKDNNGPRIV